jgi:hypothetical protein
MPLPKKLNTPDTPDTIVEKKPEAGVVVPVAKRALSVVFEGSRDSRGDNGLTEKKNIYNVRRVNDKHL